MDQSYLMPSVRPTDCKQSPLPELESLITNLNHTAMEYLRRDFFPQARDNLHKAEHYLKVARSFATTLAESGDKQTEADLVEMHHQLSGLTYNNFGCLEKS